MDQCPLHTGIEAEVKESFRRCEELEKQKEKQWDTIGTKASSSSVKWGIGISILILIAILGSMWGFGWTLSGKIDSMNDGFIALKTKVEIHLKDNHIKVIESSKVGTGEKGQ